MKKWNAYNDWEFAKTAFWLFGVSDAGRSQMHAFANFQQAPLLQACRTYLRLSKTFASLLASQVILKLTKFSRRRRGPKSLLRQYRAAYEFLRDIARYDRDVIQRCRECLTRLNAQGVSAVLVYGEKPIRDLLRNLGCDAGLTVTALLEPWDAAKGSQILFGQLNLSDKQKIIVASLWNAHEWIARLKEKGVDPERVILLDQPDP